MALVPPLRYSCIGEGLYRGSCPKRVNVPFLQRLGLRTIVSVTPKPLDESEFSDLKDRRGNRTRFVHVPAAGMEDKSRKKRGLPIGRDVVDEVLRFVLDPEAQPVYVHCLNGSQVTCLIIGCFRKLQKWSNPSILEEFSRYSDYDRLDIAFIEAYTTAACP